MKPVDKDALEKTIVRIRFELQTEERNKLRIKSKDHDHVMFIDPDDIVYLENTDHDQRFHLRDQEIRVSGRMKDWEKTLPDTFMRCHKGYIVNMKYIAGHRQHEIILKTGNTIALGRVYAKMVLEKYAAYLESRL